MKALDRDPTGSTEPVVSVLPGDHVCSVVDCADQLSERVTGWVAEGFAAGERVVYVDRPDAGSLLRWLEGSALPWTQAMADGQLVVIGPDEAYLAGSGFDLDALMARRAAFVEQSVAAGFSGVRVAAEATVVVGAFPDFEAVLAYEHAFEALCRDLPISGLCIYGRDDFAAALPRLAEAHPRAVADDQFSGRVAGARVRLAGELDVSNADLLASFLAQPAAAGPVVIDATDVGFIDVAATGVMVKAARRPVPAGKPVLCGASRQLRTILDVAGWGDVFDLEGAR